MARPAWILASLLGLPLALAWGCNSSVEADDGAGGSGGSNDCGDPPAPETENDCPPAWTCIDGQWVDTAGACPDPECPTSEPGENAACSQNGQQCSFFHEDEPCGEEQGYHDYECIEGTWAQVGTRCEPPPECPLELPETGADCSAFPAAACPFEVEGQCGTTMALAACVADENGTLTWLVTIADSCECGGQSDPNACEAAGCRWLVAGCGESPIWQDGCYPAEDCTADSCGQGYVCTEVSVDPCWNSNCDACSAPALVCDAANGQEEEGT